MTFRYPNRRAVMIIMLTTPSPRGHPALAGDKSSCRPGFYRPRNVQLVSCLLGLESPVRGALVARYVAGRADIGVADAAWPLVETRAQPARVQNIE